MARPKQRALLRRPNRLKPAEPLVLPRPTKDCPICTNLRGRRKEDGSKYIEPCTHKGRIYTINGYVMTLCVCCVKRLNRQGFSIRAGEI